MPHKTARVEYHPFGVIGAIVPWNYPFHNIFNPMLAAVFAGNAIVIKVFLHFWLLNSCYSIIIFWINGCIFLNMDLPKMFTI
jgi:hypothetical protein